MTAFMTTVAPMGWTLGRWVQVGEHVWEEQKADGSSHQFEVVYGPPTPGSSTLRLRHAGGTEVMLVGGTVQVFCQGHYMGEYLGYWEGEPQGPPPPLPGASPMAYPMAADEGFQKCAPTPQRRMSNTSEQNFQHSAPPPGQRGSFQIQQQAAWRPPPNNVAASPVVVSMFVQGVDYSVLEADGQLKGQFETAVKRSVLEASSCSPGDQVLVELSKGSVIAKVGMSACSGDNGPMYQSVLNAQTKIGQVATENLKALQGIEAATTGDIVAAVTEVKADRTASGLAPPKKRASQIAAHPANQRLAAAAKKKPQKPTNLNASAETGASLIEAAKAGDSSKLQKLLSAGADPDAFGAEGPEAGTAIFYAAEGGYSQACQVLIEAFANVNIPAAGTTAMQAAFQKGHKDVLQKLFGATFNTLDTAVTQSNAKVLGQLPGGDDIGYGDDDDLPASAAEELKTATRKLADFGKPGKEKEAESVSEDLRLPSQNEASRAREAAVKGALQTIKESTGQLGANPRAQSPNGK